MSDKDKRNDSMDQNATENVSLENSFYELGLESRIRESYRVPVDDGDQVKIIINDIEFEVTDISTKGIGIRITRLDKFKVGDVLKPLRVIISNKTFRLEGEIKHITAEGPDTSKCGIEFVNLPDDSRDILLDFLKKYGSFEIDSVF